MASKPYTSLLDLFDHFEIPYEQELNAGRIKKQLVAEFDFSPTGIITVKEHDYTKNDVLEEVSRPDFEKRIEYQKIIRSKHFITVFLEEGLVNISELITELNQLPNDEAFEEFFSPYFAHSFNNASRLYLQAMEMTRMADLLRFEDFIKPADREEGFRSIRIFLEDNIRALKNVSTETFPSKREQLKLWLTTYWSRFVNQLPDDFYDTKNDLVLHLINFSVRIQKFKRENNFVSNELTCITKINSELETLIASNHQAFTGSGSSSSGNGNYWWIVWVVLLLARFAAHC